MADLKISQLTAITVLTPATDVLPVVDVGGVTKKIQVNQILASNGVATLASATITGAATVGTTLGVTGVSTLASANVTGDLKAGTTSNFASSRLCVQGTAGTTTPDVTIGIPVNSGGNTGLAIGRSASTSGYIFLDAYKAAVGGTELVLNSINGGAVLVGLSTVVAAGGCLQLKSGVTFPATQVASSDANTLDDYVESTFSPTIVGSTLAGTATYSLQTGRATKVGRLVTFSLRVTYTVGLGTGNLRIGGLPFTAGAGSNFSIYAENIALTASYYPVASISSGNTYIGIDQLPTGGGAAAAVPYDVAGDIQISGSYIV